MVQEWVCLRCHSSVNTESPSICSCCQTDELVPVGSLRGQAALANRRVVAPRSRAARSAVPERCGWCSTTIHPGFTRCSKCGAVWSKDYGQASDSFGNLFIAPGFIGVVVGIAMNDSTCIAASVVAIVMGFFVREAFAKWVWIAR